MREVNLLLHYVTNISVNVLLLILLLLFLLLDLKQEIHVVIQFKHPCLLEYFLRINLLYFPPLSQLLYLCFGPVGLSLL